jgi:hypothetical protein
MVRKKFDLKGSGKDQALDCYSASESGGKGSRNRTQKGFDW